MPATQQGQIDGNPGRYRLRWYDRDGKRRSKKGFKTRSEARKYFRDHIEPGLTGPEPKPELNLIQFDALYLERHAADARPRTISTLQERLRHAEKRFGPIFLRELEGMTDEISSWQSKLPERSRYGIVGALRQVLGAAVR
jgi:hypothetical protein